MELKRLHHLALVAAVLAGCHTTTTDTEYGELVAGGDRLTAMAVDARFIYFADDAVYRSDKVTNEIVEVAALPDGVYPGHVLRLGVTDGRIILDSGTDLYQVAKTGGSFAPAPGNSPWFTAGAALFSFDGSCPTDMTISRDGQPIVRVPLPALVRCPVAAAGDDERVVWSGWWDDGSNWGSSLVGEWTPADNNAAPVVTGAGTFELATDGATTYFASDRAVVRVTGAAVQTVAMPLQRSRSLRTAGGVAVWINHEADSTGPCLLCQHKALRSTLWRWADGREAVPLFTTEARVLDLAVDADFIYILFDDHIERAPRG